jgi:hypothetical protein
VKDINHFSALKIDEADSAETLVPMYQISLRYIQEETPPENPRSHNFNVVSYGKFCKMLIIGSNFMKEQTLKGSDEGV